MSTATPPRPTSPLAPPEDVFWEKYSPHYEFPLSSIGSVAMHIGVLALFLGALYMLSRLTIQDTTPVPMRSMTVADDGPEGDGAAGSGGGTPQENVSPLQPPQDPMRPVPDTVLQVPELKDWLPQVPTAGEAPRPEMTDAAKKISDLNADLRKALIDGMNGKRGGGAGAGTGTTGTEGDKSGTGGDASSSGRRSVRWNIDFKTEDGRDYLRQLAAMKAVLVFPDPPDFKTMKAYRDLSSAAGVAFDLKDIPGVYFIDDSEKSARSVARALGLTFAPPLFIAYFPKDIEEELARLERAYRNRKESEILSTTFDVVIRDGKPFLRVSKQEPVTR